MKHTWKVNIPGGEILIEADTAHISTDGTLVFRNYLEHQRDQRTLFYAIEAFPPGSWTHMILVK